MTQREKAEHGAALVPGAHRVIRALDAREGPFKGVLVTDREGVAVKTGADRLEGWSGWRFAGADHVAAPLDIVRSSDAHDVLLPWCTERLISFLARRAAADAGLRAGECSTLVASLLRGLGELGEGVTENVGTWWLTDGGRPMFVIGEGDDARAGAAQIIRLLAEDAGDKALTRTLNAVRDGLTGAREQPRVPQKLLERWEDELFALAAPRPLECEVFAPERARDVARGGALEALPARRRYQRSAGGGKGDERDERGRGASRRQRRGGRRAGMRTWALLRLERLSRRSSELRDAMRERWAHQAERRRSAHITATREPQPSGEKRLVPRRSRTLLVAGAAAAAVLAGGLLWPGGATGESSGGESSGGTSREGNVTASPSPSKIGQGPDSMQTPAQDLVDGDSAAEDPVMAAAGIVIRVKSCAAEGDERCADAVADGAAHAIAILKDVPEETEFGLVDEYGDVAVVRLTPRADHSDEEGEQATADERMLVLVRLTQKWLVRDVYDVADQPQ